MKKIVNGKRYDTKTATEIASSWNGCSRSDFKFLLETLYKTDGGAWFLAGEGGALTKYAEVLEGGRSHCGGKDVVPLTPAEAKAWLEINRKTTALETCFASEIRDAYYNDPSAGCWAASHSISNPVTIGSEAYNTLTNLLWNISPWCGQ